MSGPAHLVIALPSLDDVRAGNVACPPGLGNLLARGRLLSGGGDSGLASALNLSALPAAGVRAALAAEDDPEPESSWLRVDPVHLQPDLTAVWFRAPAALDWNADSMAPLHEALDALFDAPDLEWHRPRTNAPGRLRLRAETESSFTPLHAAVGGRLDEILPRGAEAARWHALINEAQMTFHQFRPLDDPSPAGLGLWFWGAGTMPARPDEHAVTRVLCAGDPSEGRGLAAWLGVEAAPDLDGKAFPGGITLVEASMGSGTPVELPRLDEMLLEPAWRALKSGRLRSIRIVGHAMELAAGRWSPFAFWRGSRPVVAE